MFPQDFYNQDANGIYFSRIQASEFAKTIAGDFNPIHDPGSKLFCVPGDLLFAVVLSRYGLSRCMRFDFLGMVGEDFALNFVEQPSATLTLEDAAAKQYLRVERSGERSSDQRLAEGLTRAYVAFSGHNFPDILVPLMTQHGVMINPSRPLVIYSGMEIELDRLDIPPPQLHLTDSLMEVEGKRGRVRLLFELMAEGKRVGRGTKHMEMRGLRPFVPSIAEKMVEDYLLRKQAGST